MSAPDPFGPAPLGPITLRNRFVKAATFEGMVPRGQVTDRLVEFHRRFAAGGVGMSTLAYCSVSPDGRTFRDQVVVAPDVVPGLRRVADAVHAEGAAAAIQLGHAGSFAGTRAAGGRPVAPSRVFSPTVLAFSRAATAADLGRLLDDFRTATRLSVDAGFDAVEVHLGHGYLLSQFLSPFANRRRDDYGGDVERRSRFPREVVAAVKEAAGPGVAVTAKLNMADGFRRGLQPGEGVEVARLLEADGAVDALELTGGFTSRTPMYLMRGDMPLREMLAAERNQWRRWGIRLFARRILRAWPFEEAFFLPMAREVRRAVALPLMLLGGVTRLDTVEGALGEGFEFVAMARALLRDPDLVARMQAGEAHASRCVPCNRCMVEMERGGTRCVFVDAGDAGPS